jgi:hypothetical protein
MERSEIQGRPFPDFAALHPGYIDAIPRNQGGI